MTNGEMKELFSRLHISLRRRMPVILQTEAAECGLACLAMIARWYRLPADLRLLRQHSGISSRGATLRTVIDTAAVAGMKSRALRLEMDNLRALKLPCILHWDLNHFVVLVAVRRNRVVIHDPAAGHRVLGMQEVSLHFTGVALELWPTGDVPQGAPPRPRLSLWSLTGRIAGLSTTLIKLFCFSMLVESASLLLPVGMQMVLDHAIPASDTGLLTLICLGLLFFVLFRTAVSALRGWTSLVMSTLISVQGKARLFDHLLALPTEWFEKRKLGDVQSRFTSLETLQTTLTSNVVSGIMDGIMTVGLMIMMLLYGGSLLWVVLAFTLLWCLFRLGTYRAWRQASEEQIVRNARSGSHFMESLYGIHTIKALGLPALRAQHWLNLNIENANATISKTRYEMLFAGGNNLIATLQQITLLWLGASAVIAGDMTLGMFVAFSTYRGQFSDRTASLLETLLQLRMLSLHKDRVADIVLAEPETPVGEPVHPLLSHGEPAALAVKGLSFQYDPFSPLLFSDVNLAIDAGECVAITGPSGRGKTTLLKMMAGLLKPSAGEIYVNGINIRTSGVANWQACIACVLQEDTLLAGSVAENICAFDTQPDEEWIKACASLSQIHDDILAMPMGYQTLISELGSSLSGGQKQRLLIARALYRRPQVLFLDEATSHLDVDNETRINAAIRALNITRVMIAHRPSTIASADRVIDMATWPAGK
ncbi:MAG: peptidase domain-containing ABC transporter [Pantoea sp.]|uniref:peptidase domain-containing ABC transporter n=3 Tax=Pantoea sp. TaxID=69393 RepID=UPI00239467F6|nr:peptidase domain-containing ABC transporter [Pantoea sp.]MDE1187341.1 peptidase domain-containing ABC transporter [Pantoea sp.]